MLTTLQTNKINNSLFNIFSHLISALLRREKKTDKEVRNTTEKSNEISLKNRSNTFLDLQFQTNVIFSK